jgi:hypothetical protein
VEERAERRVRLGPRLRVRVVGSGIAGLPRSEEERRIVELAGGDLASVLVQAPGERVPLPARRRDAHDHLVLAGTRPEVSSANLYTGTVRLVDGRTHVVEVLGPEPLGSRRPTDRKLLFERPSQATYLMTRPQPVGFCFQADGRQARFLVNEGQWGDALLDLLARNPKAQARLARPYGPRGWLVEG